MIKVLVIAYIFGTPRISPTLIIFLQYLFTGSFIVVVLRSVATHARKLLSLESNSIVNICGSYPISSGSVRTDAVSRKIKNEVLLN